MSMYGNYPNPDLCRNYGCHKLKNSISMGCNGCLLNEKERAQMWDQKLKEAKLYAVENGVMVVVYKNELGETLFMEAHKAREIGITGQFVSPLQ